MSLQFNGYLTKIKDSSKEFHKTTPSAKPIISISQTIMKLNGIDYRDEPLSPNAFSTALTTRASTDHASKTPLGGPLSGLESLGPASSQSRAIFAGASRPRPTLSVPTDKALKDFNAIKGALLVDQSDAQKYLRNHTDRNFESFVRGDPNIECPLMDALTRYRSGGNHFLINVALQGYSNIREFLSVAAPGRYISDESVREYWAEYIDMYFGGDPDSHELDDIFPGRFPKPDEMDDVFEKKIRADAEILNAFLSHGDDFSGISLAKGIKSKARTFDPTMSTGADLQKFVTAFLQGEMIHYGSFLSASGSLGVAASFSRTTRLEFEPVESVEIRNGKGKAKEKLTAMMEELPALNDPDCEKAVVVVLKCNKAKGAVFDALPIGTLGEEQEVLLAPGHVVVPEKVIYCRNQYLLVGTVSHGGFLTNELV